MQKKHISNSSIAERQSPHTYNFQGEPGSLLDRLALDSCYLGQVGCLISNRESSIRSTLSHSRLHRLLMAMYLFATAMPTVFDRFSVLPVMLLSFVQLLNYSASK